jgi:hypothetical protein
MLEMFMEKKNEMLQQDLSQHAKHSGVYVIHLLFRERVESPDVETLQSKLEAKFGEVDQMSHGQALAIFGLPDRAYYTTNDGKAIPASIMMSDCERLAEPLADNVARTQFWDVENGANLLDSLPFRVALCDFMARAALPLARSALLADYLETALDLFPGCEAVYFQPSAKLLLPDQLRENPLRDRGAARFLYGGINVRNFRVGDTNDKVVDTLGLFAFGLADVQYHFHDLATGDVARHAYNTAIYQFENGEPIKDGHTIEGLQAGEKWACRYENALIQPARAVLDIASGAYAAGNRN